MPTYARREIVDRGEVSVYHCTSRCVRRAYLCGIDRETGKNYNHRRDWFHIRLRQLASVFMVDVLAYAIMENHFHSKVRIRPDLAAKLSDRQVARRSVMLNAMNMSDEARPLEPDAETVEAALNKPGHVEKWRERLSDISWFMRFLKQPISRRANKEDGVKGHFWEARFSSVRILDDVGELLSSTYIDLNEVRAGKAVTPEESKDSSVFERSVAWKDNMSNEVLDGPIEAASRKGSVEPAPAFLAPINVDSDNGTAGGTMTEEEPDPHRQRPSNSGFLPMTIEQYLSVVDWTGRCLREGKRGAIPADLEPIMSRLAQNNDAFLIASQNFGKLFKRYCGSPDNLRMHAHKKGLKKVHGLRFARELCQTQSL